MKRKHGHTTSLRVVIGGDTVGRLATDGGRIFFAYDEKWAKNGTALSPFGGFAPKNGGAGLPTGVFESKTDAFGGLHGVFSDSLPDGWGLLLMDRALSETLGWNSDEVTPLDRLAYMGDRALGALEFEPEMAAPTDGTPSLSELAEEAESIQDGSPGDVTKGLLLHGGSPGGARPKVTVAANKDWDRCLSGFGPVPDGYSHWIVKFRAKDHDPACVGLMEKAYAEMAAKAGLSMPETTLVPVTIKGKEFKAFAGRRFDRDGNRKKHILTLGGMLEVSHRIPCIDYNSVLKAVAMATRDARETEKAFRLMLFNVMSHNKDDHVKNFSFVLENDGWILSPGYDLTFSPGMSGHRMTAMPGGEKLSSVEKLAQTHSVSNWREILRDVFEAVSLWPSFAEKQGVPQKQTRECRTAIDRGALMTETRSLLAPASGKRRGLENGPCR